MARSRARSRVKSRRNRRPSKARTRRVSKRRMGRLSKRRMRRTSKRRTRRTSKRGRRFQRGGMELTPAQQMMRQTIRPGLGPVPVPQPEPGPDQDSLRSMDYSIYSEDDETGAIRKLLPAISVKLFNDPSADHTERYHRLLELRAEAYFNEIVNIIEDKIKVLQDQFDEWLVQDEVPNPKVISLSDVVGLKNIGEHFIKNEKDELLKSIKEFIEFEFVDVTKDINKTFKIPAEGVPTSQVENRKTCGGDFGSDQYFEIIFMINPLKYIVIIGTYDEIFSLYPNFKRSIFGRRGDNAKQQQTIFDKFKEQRHTIHRWNMDSNHPLPFLHVKWQFPFEDGTKFTATLRDLLPGGVRTTYTSAGARKPIYWGDGLPLYGMNADKIQYYRAEDAKRQHA